MSSSKSFRSMLVELGVKWYKYWESRGLFNAEPKPGKPKFFITAAYPYVNAPLHIGHARTYTIPDVIARYKMMRGYNVLFPMAFHYTGTPIVTMSDAIARGDRELIELYTKLYGIPESDIEKLKTPLGMANYFRDMAREDLKKLLLAIDWRREFTTIEPIYNMFIKWQFEKLREKGYVVQGTHPVGWCPVHGNPVGMHDTKGDVEPEIQEFTLILFRSCKEEVYYPAATLRPETVLGVTNMWVNPRAKYVIAVVDGKRMVLSERACFKIKFQRKKVEVEREVRGEDLVGERVVNPVTGRIIPVLPSGFVDPDTGTGVVMSVPAHAPYDYVALREILGDKTILSKTGVRGEELKPIPLIVVDGYSDLPARDAVVKAGVKSVLEKKLLDEATKRVYMDEHERGVMRSGLAELVDESKALPGAREFIKSFIEGVRVSEARERIVEWMRENGVAESYYEIANKPVYSRCGSEIVVKILENQWFLDYENPEWKSLCRKALSKMEIVPEEYRQQFEYVVEWLKKRACARSRGLGTRLPWDPEWIIESLSDSTIYMALYTVVIGIRKLGVEAEKLTSEFWDYIFLGKGNPESIAEKLGVKASELEAIRREFLYWYPLDNRHSGKDLIPNHLTFFIFNHTAIFPEELWPRRIVVNGHVMVEGEKMSKSLGNIIPIRKAVEEYGPDVVRLTLISSAEIGNDANFTKTLANSVMEMLERIYRLYREYEKYCVERSRSVLDDLVLARVKRVVDEVTRSLEEYRLRDASVKAFSIMEQIVREYISEGALKDTLEYILRVWVKLIAPFTPAVAEELWRIIGGKDSVFLEEWPRAEDIPSNPEVEVNYMYAMEVLEDVKNIVKAVKKTPRKALVLVSGASREAIARVARGVHDASDVREAIRIVAREARTSRPQDLVKRIQSILHKLPEDLVAYILSEGIDEEKAIRMYEEMLKRRLGFEVEVGVYSGDLGVKKGRAHPFKPLIILEF